MSSKHFSDALPPGAKLLWFEIIKVLGKGGFGITYLGRDTNLNQMVAIKEYLPSAFSSRNANNEVRPNSPADAKTFEWGLDRFLKEAQILARFRHPCIVRVVSFFRDSNTAYMVMEYVEGEGLDTILRERKTLPEDELKKLVPTLLDGLEILHNADYIHRDIKPPNILIRKKNGLPVILDFGSARQSVAGMGDQMTSLLSMGYSPFEQYDSSGDRQGPWSDIYATGGVFYRAIVGTKPKDAAVRIASRLRNDPDPMISAAEAGKGRYSEKFLNAVDQALQVLENDRPRSIKEWRPMLLTPEEIDAARRASPVQKSATAPALEMARSVTVPGAGAAEGVTRRRKKSSWRSFIASMNEFTPKEQDDGKAASPSAPASSGSVPVARAVAPTPAPEKSRERPSPPAVETRRAAVAGGPAHKAGTEWTEPGTKMVFVWIPGGAFRMGARKGEMGGKPDEDPWHEVVVDGFWLGKYPVTWGEWNQVMGNFPPGFFNPARSRHPVERIRRGDILKFLQRLSVTAKVAKPFRLPTEAEWEYAARAGSTTLFLAPGGHTEVKAYAWYKDNSQGETHPVGMKKPNAWGLHDMTGNVWESVQDWYDANYYGVSPRENPAGPATGEARVVRGGSWSSSLVHCRLAYRHRVAEGVAGSTLGFRVVRTE